MRALQQPPNAAHAERAISNPPPPSLPLQGAHVLHKGGNCAPRAGRCPPPGWQQGRDQPTAHGTVHVVRRCETLVQGGRRVTGGGARQGHPGAPPDRGRSNTDTQNAGATPRGTRASTAGATPRGTRASTANKEEGHSKAGEATRTAGTGNQNGGDCRACEWEAATVKGMAWPASPAATGCQGNPCSTGIRWGVFPAAQMAANRAPGPHTHETQRGRLRMACGQRHVDSKNSQTTPQTTSTSSIRQLLGTADAQTAHHATFSTAECHTGG